MRPWQKENINQNLPSLIKDISCNTQLLSILEANGSLSSADVDILETCGASKGKLEQSKTLLQIMQARLGGHEKLARSLFLCKQTKGLITILNGYEKEGLPNPFEVCNIPLNVTEILSKNVLFQGNTFVFGDLCDNIDTDKLELIIRDKLSVDEYTKLDLEDPITIHENYVPENLPYYIDRTLSSKTWIQHTAFSTLEDDVFLFQNIDVSKLTQVIREALGIGSSLIHTFRSRGQPSQVVCTDTSSNQKNNLTCKYIVLDHKQHFEIIAKISHKPVHLIEYADNENTKFKYITSSKEFQRIRPFLLEEGYLTSQKMLIENRDIMSPIIISDSPGMGKSALLINMANSIRLKFKKRLVILVRLSELVQHLNNVEFQIGCKYLKQFFISRVAKSSMAQEILQNILSSHKYTTEIFFDEYDEIPEKSLDLVKQLLECVHNNFVNTRIWVASRHHCCDELELLLHTSSFAIIPFTKTNQIDFLSNYWANICSIPSNARKFNELARVCLSNFESNISQDSSQKSIAGIPLICRILAHLFTDDAKIFGALDASSDDFPFSFNFKTIFEMYEAFVDERLNSVKNEYESQLVLEYHMYKAMEFLFPEFVSTQNVPNLPSSIVYRVGLMEANNMIETPRFIHRTFAEYFIAKYLFLRVQNKRIFMLESWIKENSDFAEILYQTSLKTEILTDTEPFSTIQGYTSSQHVTAYFLDQHFRSLNLADHVLSLQHLFHTSSCNRTNKFYEMILMCFVNDFHGLYNLIIETFFTPEFQDILIAEKRPWEISFYWQQNTLA